MIFAAGAREIRQPTVAAHHAFCTYGYMLFASLISRGEYPRLTVEGVSRAK